MVLAVPRRSWTRLLSNEKNLSSNSFLSAWFNVFSQTCGVRAFLLIRLAGKTHSLPQDRTFSSSSHPITGSVNGMSIALRFLVRSAGKCQTLLSKSNSDQGAARSSIFLVQVPMSSAQAK